MNINAGTMNVIRDRIKLSLCYYNAFGQKVTNAVTAVKQQILISYEQYMQSLSEDYEDTSSFGEGNKFEYNIFDNSSDSYVETVYIESSDANADKIYNAIDKLLIHDIESVDISIVTPSNIIDFPVNFVENLFSKYKTISLDMAGANCWLYLPSVRMKLDNFSIKNANIVFTGGMYEIAGSVVIDNCAIKGEDADKQAYCGFETSGQMNLSNLVISSPTNFSVGANATLKTSNWIKTSITISNVNIIFKDISSTDKKPILNVYGAYHTSISGVSSTDDIPSYPLLTLVNGKEYVVTNVSRSSISVPAYTYTIGLIGVPTFKISDFNYIATTEYDSSNSYFKILDTPPNADYSMSTFNLSGINFGNFKFLTLNKLSVSDGLVSNSTTFADMEGAGINNFVMSNVSSSDVEKLYFKSAKLFIDNCKMSSNSFDIVNDGKVIINDSEINVDGNVSIDNKYFNTFTSNGSKYYGDTISITRSKTNDANDIPSDVAQTITFKDCQMYGNLVANSIDNIQFTNTLFDDVDSISVHDIPEAILDGVVKCRKSKVDIVFTNTNVSGSQLSLSDISRNQEIKFEKTTGSMFIKYLNDCDPSNMLKLVLVDSVVDITGINADESTDVRNVKFNSKGSVGSCVFGMENINITPDYPSDDNQYVEYSDKRKTSTERIYYGKY